MGTNEVEADSLRREWNRSVKKGYQNGIKEFKNSGEYKRDKEYVRGLIHLRSEQAKADWSGARRKYGEKKEQLKRACESQGKGNLYKATIKKIRKQFQSVYEQGRRDHGKKIERLERRHCSTCKNKKPEELKEARDQWIRRIACGTGLPDTMCHRQVPVYGNLNLDPDELSYLPLPPKYWTPWSRDMNMYCATPS